MKTGFARNAIVLGLLAALGPFATDTYLPALPTIAVDLNTSIAATQASMIAFFGAIGLTQVIYGPVSDIVGRRAPLYFGLGMFIIGSIGCALSPDIETLVGFRFVQGVGACAGIVIPRAIVRDLHTGLDATRLLSLIMLVFSISPLLAPLAGSGLIVVGGWRSIFVAVTLIGVLGVGLVMFALPETRLKQDRVKASLRVTLASYSTLLRDRHFLGIASTGGFAMAGFLVFLANSSFVYVEHFGLTPTQYSFAFALNAMGFIGGAQFSSMLSRRLGLGGLVRAAVATFAALAVGLFVMTLFGIDRLEIMTLLLFLMFACLGLIVPANAALALDAHGPIAGMAAALLGTIQMLLGAVVITLISLYSDGTSLPMVGAIAACAVGSLVSSRIAIRTRDGFKHSVE